MVTILEYDTLAVKLTVYCICHKKFFFSVCECESKVKETKFRTIYRNWKVKTKTWTEEKEGKKNLAKIFNNRNYHRRRLAVTPISTIPTWRSVPFCLFHHHEDNHQLFAMIALLMDIDHHVHANNHYHRLCAGCELLLVLYLNGLDYLKFHHRSNRRRLVHVREHVNVHDLDQYALDRYERFDDLDDKKRLQMFNKFLFLLFFFLDIITMENLSCLRKILLNKTKLTNIKRPFLLLLPNQSFLEIRWLVLSCEHCKIIYLQR